MLLLLLLVLHIIIIDFYNNYLYFILINIIFLNYKKILIDEFKYNSYKNMFIINTLSIINIYIHFIINYVNI